jgi:non-ribosomal peptide synthetase component F
VDGQLVQVIAPSLRLALEVVDLCTLPVRERQSTARRLVRAEVQRSFDLARGPLLRGYLLRLDEQEHLLLLTMHHIISDGWSLGVLTQELAVLYDAGTAGDPSPLPALPLQYADFAYWQQQWQHNAELEAQLAYWQHQLRVPYPALELPTDRPRTPDALRFLYSARQPVVWPQRLVEALKRWSYREGSTLFMTLLAAFKILLYSYTRQEDLCVGSLIANRHRREIEGLIGLVVNTVILRTDLGGNPTCREVLQRVRATTLAAYAHQDLPFEVLVRSCEHESNRPRVSLCQVMLILQDAVRQLPQPSASSLRFLHTDPGIVELETMPTTFDIVFMLREGPQGLSGSCVYKPHLFDAATIQRLVDDFQQVLERISAVPEQPLAAFHALGELGGRRP